MIKTLYLDIETSYSVMACFGLFPDAIPHDNIIQEWHIISAAWKWAGQKKCHHSVTYSMNDKKVVKELMQVLDEADEVVWHNGDKFDFKKIQTRAIANNLGPVSKPVSIDTLKQARKHFAFTSNRLDYITKFLGLDGKLETEKGLWLKVLRGDKAAIDRMVKYNIQDVLILEELHVKLKPYIDIGISHAIHMENDRICPKCGDERLSKMGFRNTKTAKYQRYKCNGCGSTASSPVNVVRGLKVLR